jgi:hypothetical protein
VEDEKYLQIGAPAGLWVTVTDLPDEERPDRPDGPYDGDATLQTRPIVATILCTPCTDTYSFLGNLIVRPEWRDQKVAMHMFQTCVLSNPRIYGMNAVSSLTATYQRTAGFSPAFEIVRFSGALPDDGDVEAELNADAEAEAEAEADSLIVPADAIPADALAAFDRETFGCTAPSRAAFVAAWLGRTQPGAAALCMVAADGRVVGLVASRPAHKGIRIGPLVAPSPRAALRLLRAIDARLRSAAPASASEYYIDVPAHVPHTLPLFARLRMVEVTRLTRMYLLNKKFSPPQQLAHTVYATTSSSIGP